MNSTFSKRVALQQQSLAIVSPHPQHHWFVFEWILFCGVRTLQVPILFHESPPNKVHPQRGDHVNMIENLHFGYNIGLEAMVYIYFYLFISISNQKKWFFEDCRRCLGRWHKCRVKPRGGGLKVILHNQVVQAIYLIWYVISMPLQCSYLAKQVMNMVFFSCIYISNEQRVRAEKNIQWCFFTIDLFNIFPNRGCLCNYWNFF